MLDEPYKDIDPNVWPGRRFKQIERTELEEATVFFRNGFISEAQKVLAKIRKDKKADYEMAKASIARAAAAASAAKSKE